MNSFDANEVLIWGLYSFFLPFATLLAARKASKTWNGDVRSLGEVAAGIQGYRTAPESSTFWNPSSTARAFFFGITWLPRALLPICANAVYEIAAGPVTQRLSSARRFSSLSTLAQLLLSSTVVVSILCATIACWRVRARFDTNIERLPAVARRTAVAAHVCGASLIVTAWGCLLEEGLGLAQYSTDAAILQCLGAASIALGIAARRVADEVDAAHRTGRERPEGAR